MSEAREGRLPWERGEVPYSEEAMLAEIGAHAARIAAGAGALLLDLFQGPLTVEFKDQNQRDPVSQADRRAEQYLREAIQERFPDHAILGEEGKDAGPAGAEYTWVLDPLDGTTNYINGLPLFAVSVGVLRWGRPAAGAIWTAVSPSGAPARFSAHAGAGAVLDGRRLHIEDRGPVSNLPAPRRLAAVPGGFAAVLGFSGPLRRRPGEPRVLGSIAVESAFVAAGVLQYAIFWSPKIWDIAAAATIVREAGGVALVRSSGGWRDLDLFRPRRDRKTGALRPLREWSAPVIVAAPPLARSVSLALQPTLLGRALRLPHHPLVRRSVKLVRRLQRQFGPPAAEKSGPPHQERARREHSG